MKKSIFFLLFPTLLLSGTLKKLHCIPDGAYTSNEIYEALGLKQPSWYEFWKQKEPMVHAKLLPSLRESLENYYKSQGYYHVKIEIKEQDDNVSFIIHKGEPVLIKSIDRNLSFTYKDLITFHVDDYFKATTFVQIKKEIKQKLLEDGYCNAIFDSKARIDIEKNVAYLSYHLQKNPICHFGKIHINKPNNIPQKVIQSRLNYQSGTPYSSKRIKESYSTISGLEAFDSVQISQKQKSDNIDLNIDVVKKKKRIRQEIGVGYETNLGPKGIFRWEERNFQGGARKISFDLKYSHKEKYIKNSFFNPAFMPLPFQDNKYLDLKNEFLYSEYMFENFDEKKLADYLHLQKDFYQFSIDMGLGLEKIEIKKTGDVCNVSDGHFLLFFPFIKVILDHRDSKINPTNGLYLSGYFESGLKYLASSTSYSKLIFEGRLIHTLNNFTFASKARVGFINEFQKSLPESKLFFAGGAYSNRAYGYKRLGASDSMCDEAGAKTLIDTTLEVSHPLYKKIDGALFYDATMISEKSFSFKIDFIHAAGFGIRYLTPIGPVKFDVGFNIEKKEQYALHFQIGQSF